MLVERQNGHCAICNEVPENQPLAVDHDHKTGEVRELLCTSCNVGLGHFKDDPDLMQAAIEYIARHRTEPSGVFA